MTRLWEIKELRDEIARLTDINKKYEVIISEMADDRT